MAREGSIRSGAIAFPPEAPVDNSENAMWSQAQLFSLHRKLAATGEATSNGETEGHGNMTNDDHSLIDIDTGAGRWFVLERVVTDTLRLIAGPYQTEAAVDRWIYGYAVPAGVDLVVRVRCEGTWQDAVAHTEAAFAEWRARMGKQP